MNHMPGDNDGTGTRRLRTWGLRLGVTALAASLALFGYGQSANAGPTPTHKPVPVNTAFEGKSGIRVTRITVVADGGLIDVRFMVLDRQRAHRFVGDSDGSVAGKDRIGPPRLHSGRRNAEVTEVASMTQHGEYRPGQTYFLLYLNPQGRIRPGDALDLIGDQVTASFAGIRVE